MKVYVTKYSLTKGILEMEGEIETDENRNTLAVRGNGQMSGWTTYYRDGEWHETMEDATKRAIEIIGAKRKSIQKSLKKLDELENSLLTPKAQ